MTELRTEEEQLEALKKWWDESGKSWVTAVLVVAAGWTSWNFYQDGQQNTRAAASSIYQQMIEKSVEQEDAAKDEAFSLASQLKKDFKDTTYAQFASLYLAKQAVEAKDLATAEKELKFVVEQAAKGDVYVIANLRLARVEHALGQSEAALKRLQVKELGEYEGAYLEVKGDILFDLGRKDEARDAYQLAATKAETAGANNPTLEMKLDDLAVAGETKPNKDA